MAQQLYQGIPREEIPWFPIINPDLCDNCLKCLEFCPHDVYGTEDGRIDVARPMNCLVSCNSCKNVCPKKAIFFMERSDLNMLVSMLHRSRGPMSR